MNKKNDHLIKKWPSFYILSSQCVDIYCLVDFSIWSQEFWSLSHQSDENHFTLMLGEHFTLMLGDLHINVKSKGKKSVTKAKN